LSPECERRCLASSSERENRHPQKSFSALKRLFSSVPPRVSFEVAALGVHLAAAGVHAHVLPGPLPSRGSRVQLLRVIDGHVSNRRQRIGVHHHVLRWEGCLVNARVEPHGGLAVVTRRLHRLHVGPLWLWCSVGVVRDTAAASPRRWRDKRAMRVAVAQQNGAPARPCAVCAGWDRLSERKRAQHGRLGARRAGR